MTDEIREYLTNSPIWEPVYPSHTEPKSFTLNTLTCSGRVEVYADDLQCVVRIWSGLGQPEDYAYQYNIESLYEINQLENFIYGT